MMLLAVDTSTRQVGLALYAGEDGVRAEWVWHSPNRHTEHLAPMVALLLERSGITWDEITALAVALGPGSFTGLRIGIVGAPRLEKNVQQVLDAFAACQRDDLQLFVTCLSGAESVPDDARIHACEYQLVARELYYARLAAIDVLVMPIEPGELLTTGVIGDAIGGGIAAICSRWDFLSESLGDAAIYYDGTTADLTRVFEQLDAERVARSVAAMAGLRPRYDWGSIAAQHLQLLRAVGTLKL